MMVCEHSTLSNQYRDWGWLHGKVLRWSLALTYPLADVRVTVSSCATDDLATISGILRALRDGLQPYCNALADSGLPVGNLKPVKNRALLISAFATLGGYWDMFGPWVGAVVGQRREIVAAMDWTDFDAGN